MEGGFAFFGKKKKEGKFVVGTHFFKTHKRRRA
jgi:hypothetical protein